MILTEDDAAKLLHSVLNLLQSSNAREVLDGIEESRRLGIEELLPEQKGLELKQVARTRSRPPSNVELVHIVLERLYQRLVVLPTLGAAIRKRLGARDVLWRVDTEFVSVDRFPEARLSDLLPDSAENVMLAFAEIRKLVPLQTVERV
jgi:hypothetical protein